MLVLDNHLVQVKVLHPVPFIIDSWLSETLLIFLRYNCNRYNEDDAKAARDAQEVS